MILEFLAVFIFVVIILVQFCIILLRNGMFYFIFQNPQIWLLFSTVQ